MNNNQMKMNNKIKKIKMKLNRTMNKMKMIIWIAKNKANKN